MKNTYNFSHAGDSAGVFLLFEEDQFNWLTNAKRVKLKLFTTWLCMCLIKDINYSHGYYNYIHELLNNIACSYTVFIPQQRKTFFRLSVLWEFGNSCLSWSRHRCMKIYFVYRNITTIQYIFFWNILSILSNTSSSFVWAINTSSSYHHTVTDPGLEFPWNQSTAMALKIAVERNSCLRQFWQFPRHFLKLLK
jgi:hypothetical protein